MARRQQHDLAGSDSAGPDAVELRRELRLGRPQVELGERLERLAQQRGVGADQRRQLVEDPALLLVDRRLRLAPGVAQLHDHQRLDEQRLAAARRVVDDALDLGPRLGADRDDVAPVAQRDDRLLERAAELRAHEACPAGAGAGRRRRGRWPGARPGAATRCPAARPSGSKLRSSVLRSAGSGWSRRPRSRSSGRRSSASDVARRAAASRVSAISRNCAGSRRPPRAARPIHGSMSCAAPIPTPARSWSSDRAWSVSSRRAPDDDRVVGRLEGLGQAARRVERGLLREPRADGRELEERDRAGVHQVRRAAERRAPRDEEPPRDGDPRLARVRDPDPRRRRPRPAPARRPGAASRRSGDAGSHRSMPVWDRSMRERGARRARGPRRAARRRGGLVRGAGTRRRPCRAHGGQALDGLDGADEQRRGPRRRLGHDVQAVVHAVDKVHVGDARAART